MVLLTPDCRPILVHDCCAVLGCTGRTQVLVGSADPSSTATACLCEAHGLRVFRRSLVAALASWGQARARWAADRP